MSEILLYETKEAVAILTINDAPYNRMSLDFMDQLEDMVNKISVDSSIRAVVLTASGLDNFSVGMNLKQLPEGIERKGSRDALFDQRLSVIEKIENMYMKTKIENTTTVISQMPTIVKLIKGLKIFRYFIRISIIYQG